MELVKITNINKHAIKYLKNKQSFYRSIDTLNILKLETLKTYIKIHPKIRFI